MPVRKVKGGFSFGGAAHDSKASAEKSYVAYLAKKHGAGKRKKGRAAAAYQAWREKGS